MSRSVLGRLLAAALAALVTAACGGSGDERVNPAPEPQAEDPSVPPASTAPEGEEEASQAAIPRVGVTLYFPSSFGDVLVDEAREIYGTKDAGDRAKQILAELIAGPVGAGAERALPEGTALRQLYVTPDGVAWADFSAEIKVGIGGGSAEEMMTVYAVVDSIALNVPEIARVGILVDGRPVDTLSGHLDLRRPLPPRRDLVRGEPPAEEPPPSPAPDPEATI